MDIKDGVYQAEVKAWDLIIANGADPYVLIAFAIGGVELTTKLVFGEKVFDFSGRKVSQAELSMDQLRAAGFLGDSFEELVTTPPPDIPVTVECKTSYSKDGREFKNYRFKTSRPASRADIKALDSKFAGMFRAKKARSDEPIPF